MKIRIAQCNPVVGDIEGNTRQLINQLKQAEADEVDLLIATELVVCGYPAMDLLERPAFIEAITEANNYIISQTARTALLWGTVTPTPQGAVKQLYNSAIAARGGTEIARVHKTLLPNYDIFDEYRYFEANQDFKTVDIDGVAFGVTICEDIWYNQNEYQYHNYQLQPAGELRQKGAQALINISASPYSRNKPGVRRKMLAKHSRDLQVPILFANQCGANTEVIFDGDSLAMDSAGEIQAAAGLFRPNIADVILDEAGNLQPVSGPLPAADIQPREQVMFEALQTGLREYLDKTGLPRKVLIGLSGGIDSALTTVIAGEALGSDNVEVITLPSEFSSEGSVTDSEVLARNLGIRMHQMPVSAIYEEVLHTLAPLFSDTSFSVAEENIQSRIRGMLLMAVSNKFGHIVLNTGNKSEMAVGYCTLYGDMAGGLAVLSDVYKMEVYRMAEWLNEHYYGKEVIPKSILEKPPSAELRPDQKDSDSLPEYPVMDAVLEKYIEEQRSVKDIVALGYDEQTVSRIARLVDINEYKRKQAPPGLRVSPKAFGFGRRMPIVQQWTRQQPVAAESKQRE